MAACTKPFCGKLKSRMTSPPTTQLKALQERSFMTQPTDRGMARGQRSRRSTRRDGNTSGSPERIPSIHVTDCRPLGSRKWVVAATCSFGLWQHLSLHGAKNNITERSVLQPAVTDHPPGSLSVIEHELNSTLRPRRGKMFTYPPALPMVGSLQLACPPNSSAFGDLISEQDNHSQSDD